LYWDEGQTCGKQFPTKVFGTPLATKEEEGEDARVFGMQESIS
jgi:hypothetical protein